MPDTHNHLADDFTLLLFGDSILANWFSTLCVALPQYRVMNCAMCGQTTSDLLKRVQSDLAAPQCNTVLLHAGINDIAENGGTYDESITINNLNSMVLTALSSGKNTLLSNLLPIDAIPWRVCSDVYNKVTSLNNGIAQIAQQHNILLVDFFTAMADKTGKLSASDARDGVHPNKRSYSKMQVELKHVLQALHPNS